MIAVFVLTILLHILGVEVYASLPVVIISLVNRDKPLATMFLLVSFLVDILLGNSGMILVAMYGLLFLVLQIPTKVVTLFLRLCVIVVSQLFYILAISQPLLLAGEYWLLSARLVGACMLAVGFAYFIGVGELRDGQNA